MSFGLLLYLFFGLIWLKMEHDMFDIDFEETTAPEAALTIGIQIVHYIRVVITWPLYAIEDLLIDIDNAREG
jgi:hypothetical protein